MEITREVTVPGTPDEVAAFVSDLSRWPDWFALHKGWIGEPPAGAAREGVRFKHHVRILGVPGDAEWTVVELDFPHRVRLKGKGSKRVSMALDVEITPDGDAASRVAFTADVSGLLLRPVEGQLRSWLDVRVDRTLDALRDQLG